MAVNDLITFRKGTASQWISANPVLASGEPGYDLTNSILKIGNGVSNWVALSGIGSTSVGGGGSSSTSVIEYGSVSNFPASGVGSTIYISTDNGRMYRWTSTVYQELGPISYAPIGSDSRWDLFLPPAPTGLVVAPGNTQVSLSWNAPTVSAQTPITDYTVQYSSNNGNNWTTFSKSESSNTSAIITGLLNDTSYIFRVKAVNVIGDGSYSAISNAAIPFTSILRLTFDTGFDDLAQGLTAGQTSSGVSRSTSQVKGGSHSLLVNTNNISSSTSRRLTYGSGNQWNIWGSDCTVQAWVYLTQYGNYQGIICRDDQASNRNWQILILSPSENNNLGLTIFGTSGVYDTQPFPLNQWVHIAAVRDSGILRLYKNGVQVASTDVSGLSSSVFQSNGPLSIGSLNTNSGEFGFYGYIDEVLVSNTCLYRSGIAFTPSSFV
jgi:hypothetical protein